MFPEPNPARRQIKYICRDRMYKSPATFDDTKNKQNNFHFRNISFYLFISVTVYESYHKLII